MQNSNGLRDWKIQRFTAIYLTVYLFFLIGYIFKQPLVGYEQWHALFADPFMRIATLFSLICIALHAWIGIWTVLTDYVKSLSLRYFIQSLIILGLFGYFVWGVWIVWSI